MTVLHRAGKSGPGKVGTIGSGTASQAGEPGWRMDAAVRAPHHELRRGDPEDRGQLLDFPGGEASLRVDHPKNVYLREADVLGQVDDWLAEMFAPANIDATLDVLAGQAAQLEDPATRGKADAAQARIAEYDAQISRYRASLDAGGDPAVIGPWIAETQARKVTAQAEIRTATGRRQMSRDDIAAIVAAFADLAQVVREADPADKADVYAQLNLTLTYQPGQRLVEVTVKPGLNMRKGFVRVRGGT